MSKKNRILMKKEKIRLKFEVGKFYSHPGGRQIAVLGLVESYKWGKMFVIEEADPTGHAISCSEINDFADITAMGWIEIGMPEWMRNFDDPACPVCGKVFEAGTKFVNTDKGPVHFECFDEVTKEQGPNKIDLPKPKSLLVDSGGKTVVVSNQN